MEGITFLIFISILSFFFLIPIFGLFIFIVFVNFGLNLKKNSYFFAFFAFPFTVFMIQINSFFGHHHTPCLLLCEYPQWLVSGLGSGLGNIILAILGLKLGNYLSRFPKMKLIAKLLLFIEIFVFCYLMWWFVFSN